jgi:hypothetical protein
MGEPDCREQALAMKKTGMYTLGVALAAALAASAGGAAPAKPPGPGAHAATLSATPAAVTFARPTTLAGKITGAGNAGVSVTLQQNPYPFTGGYKNVPGVAAATTDANGNFAFPNVVPQLNTRYQAASKKPKATSPPALVNVRLAVTRHVSKATVHSGARVRFSGAVRPTHDGKVVRIQRRSTTGKWRTVAKTVTAPSSATESKYSKRVRIRHTGTYRVRVTPADGDHVTGTSARKKIRVV